jgi:aspartokinase
MDSPVRLGGFKILKDMAGFSLLFPEHPDNLPALFCKAIAGKKINLPYITCVQIHGDQSVNIIVDADDGLRTSLVIEEISEKLTSWESEGSILSLFPHKKNPGIIGSLFEVFGQQRLYPDAIANSPSALSIVLKNEDLGRAGDALFEPFSFSAYRSPDDWKLAQKGKEQLYKEVVASYQEQKPKVYALEYSTDQTLMHVSISNEDLISLGRSLKAISDMGLEFSFSVVGHDRSEDRKCLSFCLPSDEQDSYIEIIGNELLVPDEDIIGPVSVFSMNGPHFGDRYGIVSEILTALGNNSVDLLGLSCTIASVTGVVHSSQLNSAVEAIKSIFEVPSIIRK